MQHVSGREEEEKEEEINNDLTILKTPSFDSQKNSHNDTIKKNSKLWSQKTIVTKSTELNYLANIDLKQETKAFRQLFSEDPLIRLEKLAEGAYGQVYKGVYALKDEFVAIKYIPFMARNDYSYKEALNEAKLMDFIQKKTPVFKQKNYSFL